jgi:chromate transporter
VESGRVSVGEAFRFWLKLGFISFGGPAGQIAIMHQELVERRRWISENRFLHALNYCMLLPGPEATQLATYIGWIMHRTWGGIVAGALFVLPSVFILIALSWMYLAYGEVPLVAGLFYGVKPAVVAVVIAAAYRIGSRALKNGVMWVIAAAAFLAIMAGAPFPGIVIAAAAIGLVGGRVAPARFSAGVAHGPSGTYGPALIDDHTTLPPHAVFSWSRLALNVGLGLLIWALALAGLALAAGWQGTLSQMAWFFTKAALVTFGGAYAVLPYVFQASVEHYGWASAAQMIDGLALGETTPGPLIMFVAFVGFVGAWTKEVFGPDGLFLAGFAGAWVATFFTFLPSFVFIFAGAPFIETTHGNLRFTAPLSAITAAVVGVVLSLAVFFARHVFWPQGLSAGADWVAVAIAAAALAALLRYKVGLIPVIFAAGAAGMALQLTGLA